MISELIWGFLRVGCFAFGGAYGAIPLIRDVVLSYGWLTEEELTYMIAVSESTPGPIMVNVATYVGSSQAGFWGAAAATAAVVLPSFIIVLLICAVLKALLKNQYVQAALRGIKPAVVGLILATGIYMTVSALIPAAGDAFDWRALLITAILALINFGAEPVTGKKVSSIMLILLAAVCGAAIY